MTDNDSLPMNANLSQIPLIRLCSYLILGTATALKIRGQSLLADIREFRHFKKKRREDEAEGKGKRGKRS